MNTNLLKKDDRCRFRSLFLASLGMLLLSSACTPRQVDQPISMPVATPRGDSEETGRVLETPKFKTVDLRRNLKSSLLKPYRGPYRVGPGDILSIEIAENKDSQAKSKVMPDGMLYYDVAPGINVKGKTIKEISTTLSASLEKDYVKPVVSVNVDTADSQRFWVLGQAQNPGSFPITKPTNLIQALSLAGGLYNSQNSGIQVNNPESADLDRAILIRNGNLVPVDFRDLIEKGDMSQNVYVQAGDYIYLPSTLARSIYVLGQVQRPGAIFYDTNATVLSSVAAAGGPLANSLPGKTLIIRGNTQQPEVAEVDIRRIMKGFDPDLQLEGGDIIWVPKTAWTKLGTYLGAVMQTSLQTIAVQEGIATYGNVGSGVRSSVNIGNGVTFNTGGNNNTSNTGSAANSGGGGGTMTSSTSGSSGGSSSGGGGGSPVISSGGGPL